jgi:hypothetical protein
LKVNPVSTSNEIMLTVIGKKNTLNTDYWSGSAWSATVSHDIDIDSIATRCADFAWEPTGNKGLLLWGTTAGKIDYKTFTAPNTFGADTNMTMGTNTHSWVQLRTNYGSTAGDAKVLGAILEATTLSIGAIKWDGATFNMSGINTISSATTVDTYECFDLKYQKTTTNHDFLLKVVNQVSQAWKVNLKAYDSSNLSRISSAKINLHDGSASDQIIVDDGAITQSEGPQYDLSSSSTIYISVINLQATTIGTSYIYMYLKAKNPDNGVYTLYMIVLRID